MNVDEIWDLGMKKITKYGTNCWELRIEDRGDREEKNTEREYRKK